jgi:5-methylcytosine-specific restriction endonuclease McrA
VSQPNDREAIAFAEKVLLLLEEGRYVATYKYAVLQALLDLALEHTTRTGEPPEIVTTRQLAEKILEIYWPQTSPFPIHGAPDVLVQNAGGQAEIVAAIDRFRSHYAPDPSAPLWEGRRRAPGYFERLVQSIEWKLIEMPLPRLQVAGGATQEFIYRLGWTHPVRRSEVASYQRDGEGPFDNRVILLPGVGRYLLQLNGLLRPLIHRRWAAMVARLNRHDDARLEEFLFGAERVPTAKIRAALWLLQDRTCFYCDRRLDLDRSEVDHFIPWARYPDNGLDNLVVVDDRCNRDKRAFLAAAPHVARWVPRLESGSSTCSRLDEIAGDTGWERHSPRTLSVARAIYLGLPPDVRLWLRRNEFVEVDRDTLTATLAST